MIERDRVTKGEGKPEKLKHEKGRFETSKNTASTRSSVFHSVPKIYVSIVVQLQNQQIFYKKILQNSQMLEPPITSGKYKNIYFVH